MKTATKRAASEALAQMLAVSAMLVIASVVFYWRWRARSWSKFVRRHSGTVRRTGPGISRFRVRCFASPRN